MGKHSETLSSLEINISTSNDDELKQLTLNILSIIDKSHANFMTKEKALHLTNEILFKGLVENINPNTYLD